MIRANTLNVLLTNWCNAECSHCCMNAGPRRSDSLAEEDVRKIVGELHRHNRLKVVVFAGGEPTARRNTLRHALRFCSSLGIRTRMVTNAYWARNERSAKKLLQDLRADGLNELNISCDDYHQAYIPIANVINAWQASKGLGFGAVIIANGTGPNNVINPGYLAAQLGEAIPVRSIHDKPLRLSRTPKRDGTYFGISYSTFQRLERAAENVPEPIFVDVEDPSLLEGGCPHVIRNAALSPKGRLLACCGFEFPPGHPLDLGDARAEDCGRIIERANGHDFVAALAFLGPYFLLKVVAAVAPDLVRPQRFGSVCEICRTLTTDPEKMRVVQQTSECWLPALREVQAKRKAMAA
ncbi:MAG: radical SAM protein [Ignavibacteriales bacterium]